MLSKSFGKKLNDILWLFLTLLQLSSAEQQKLKLTCTTFPIYQITRNILQGSQEQVDLLLSSQTGCPHDYALSPQDMQMLSKTDVLIINGLGLEDFIAAIELKNPKLIVIDSSLGIEKIINYGEELSSNDFLLHNINPHLFVSPRMAGEIGLSIASQLSKQLNSKATLLLKNGQAYAYRLNLIADNMVELGKQLKNQNIMQSHDIFDYFCRDMGINIISSIQHEGQEPSAFEMINLISMIKKNEIRVIFLEPQYSKKIGIKLANETGAKIVELDPVATGPKDAPLDYYEKMMLKNIEMIRKAFGEK